MLSCGQGYSQEASHSCLLNLPQRTRKLCPLAYGASSTLWVKALSYPKPNAEITPPHFAASPFSRSVLALELGFDAFIYESWAEEPFVSLLIGQ